MIQVKRALISVSDKTGIVDFARKLAEKNVEIISTGGTASLLAEAGIKVTPISAVTNFPEILDGRVKTLTPQVHAGLLARRDKKDHMKQLKELKINPIDMVVVNLYPFEATVNKAGVAFEEAIENIDIGGPAMLRSAAKNFDQVAVITDPADYARVLAEMDGGGVGRELALDLARAVFRHTSRYDGLIAAYLAAQDSKSPESPVSPELPFSLQLNLIRKSSLRYGENPHQRGALYEAPGFMPRGLAQAEVLQGKEMSFNNYLDLDSAWNIVLDFDQPAVAIVKHTNPCGAAVAETVEEAYRNALSADPVSAYGGIVGCNGTVTVSMAQAMVDIFLEAVVAPGYSQEALGLLSQKKNLRLLRLPSPDKMALRSLPELRTVSGGFLLQDKDRRDIFTAEDLKVVSRRWPTEAEMCALKFAWTIVRHLKSNAVAFASADRLLSMGCGQTSRVECVRLALAKSRLPLKGSALASDAFFPFRDSLDIAAEAGATAIIQPGGSVRDAESIAAADEYGMAMVMTGVRHFKH